MKTHEEIIEEVILSVKALSGMDPLEDTNKHIIVFLRAIIVDIIKHKNSRISLTLIAKKLGRTHGTICGERHAHRVRDALQIEMISEIYQILKAENMPAIDQVEEDIREINKMYISLTAKLKKAYVLDDDMLDIISRYQSLESVEKKLFVVRSKSILKLMETSM